MSFTFHRIPRSSRWQVLYGSMLMAVFFKRDQAEAYCARKNKELENV